MKAKIVFPMSGEGGGAGCAGGQCPTVYQTETGAYILQGYKVSDQASAEFPLANDETLIELPKEFIESFIKSMKK